MAPVRFTVAVPVWNGAGLIRIVVDSVRAQTYPHWEVIVGDNASTDGTADVVSSYDDPRIRVHRWPDHVGTYENFNRTMALGEGTWVIPIGADDRIVPDGLETLAAAITDPPDGRTTRPIVMALSPCRRVDPEGRPAERAYYGSQAVKTVGDGRFTAATWLAAWGEPGAPPWNIGSVAFSRDALEVSGGFDPAIGLSADAELLIRIAVHGDVLHVARPLLDYTVRDASDGNLRFAHNRRANEPRTPLGAALLSALAAHEAVGVVDRGTRRAILAGVAATHLQRAGQHRILDGGRGRRAAIADVWRAARYSPRTVMQPRSLVYAIGAMAAPRSAIRWASAWLSRAHTDPGSRR